jgi:DNA adenine methylase
LAVVQLFRVLRHPETAQMLIRALQYTPFARVEFDDAFISHPDPVENARRLIIRSHMGFGSSGLTSNGKTGFRSKGRTNTHTSVEWHRLPPQVSIIAERLRGVVIENQHAQQVMSRHDDADTVHYVDPPYLHETRKRVGKGRGYNHEMDHEAHAELLTFLKSLQGAILLSGYKNDLYDQTLTGWQRFDRDAYATGALPRVESLWLNPSAQRKDLLSL